MITTPTYQNGLMLVSHESLILTMIRSLSIFIISTSSRSLNRRWSFGQVPLESVEPLKIVVRYDLLRKE